MHVSDLFMILFIFQILYFYLKFRYNLKYGFGANLHIMWKHHFNENFNYETLFAH